MKLKTNLDGLFSTNRDAEEDGVWVDVGDGMKMKIRAFSAKAVTTLREQLMLPFAALQRTGTKIPEEKSEEIGLRVIAGGVIADWSGINGYEGEGADEKEVAIPYTADNAYDVLKSMPRFANFIVGISMDAQMYKDALREDGAKN